MEQTLLEKAKLHQNESKTTVLGQENIELAIAWAKDEISLSAVQYSLGRKATSMPYPFLATALRSAVRNGTLVERG